MHSETTSQQHSTALYSTSGPSAGTQAETALLPPVSVQPATAVGVLPLPSVFLTVDFPNGSETFNARDIVTVRWSTSVQDGTLITSHAVRLFADGNLVTEVTDLPGTTQSYQLTLPDINTTRAVVSVSAINGIRVLAGDRSDNVFTIQGASTGPVITAIDPPAIRAGATTRVTVNGMHLPANAGDYAVVNSAGQRFMGITLLPLSISATATVFDVMVASSTSPGPYRFVAGTASAPFDILASQAPDITSLEPGQIPPGATTLVVVRGVNLPISPFPYLVVNSVGQQINGYGIELDGGNQTTAAVRLRITIAASVTPGQYGLRVMTSSGSDTAPLEITGIVMPPDITAVAPSQILAGQTTQVIVDGLNLPSTANGYSVLKSDGQPAQGVSVQLTSPGARSAILQITVSASTPSGPYQLRAQNAAGFDTFPLQILPNMAPDITALQPSQVVAGSTTRVTVSGSNLPLATSGYTVVDNAGQGVVGVGLFLVPGGQTNQVALDISIPAFVTAGQYRLRAQNMAGFDIAPLDILASISRVELSASPSAQSISPGQNASYIINLNRANFAGAVTLAVSGLPSSATAIFSPNPAPGTSSLLTIATPASTAPGTRVLTISGAAPGATITATTVSLTVGGGAVIMGFTPTSGPVGTDVDISGPNLAGATGVQFGSVNAPEFTVNPSGSITAEVPEGTPPNVVVSVFLPGGRRVTSTDSFAVTAATNTPRINSFMPTSGKPPDTNVPGTEVTIRGANFVPNNTVVLFNGNPKRVPKAAKSVSADGKMLTVNVPAGAITGTLRAKVMVNGTSIKSKPSAVEFVVGSPKILTAPSSGAVGAMITVTGMNFVPGKDTNGKDYTVVQFSGASQNGMPTVIPAINPTVTTTRIDLIVPMGAITGPVSVVTPQTPPAMFPSPFTVIPPGPKPEITRFAPLDGPEGAQVELAGKNFTGVTVVMFGGVLAPFVVNSTGSITAYVPIRLNVGDADRRVAISVSAAGDQASAGDFTVLAPKTLGTSFFGISGLVPGRGRVNDKVLIFGGELDRLERVEFAGVSAGFISKSRNSIEATVPAGAMNGIVSITGTDRNGMRRTGVTRPEIVGADFITDTSKGQLAIDSFTPRFGPSGTQVTIRGVNFKFMGNPNVSRVQFSNGSAAFTITSDTEIIATVPSTGLKGRDPIILFPSSEGVPVTSGTDFITLSQGTLPPPKAKEAKEGKDAKEIKEKEKEFKEKESDGKDFRKDFKDNREGKDLFEFSSVGVVEPMEWLARLEGAVGQLMHFIRPDLRPDLHAGALKGEPEHSSDDRVALSQLLQKQASDAKQAKDTKDVEKPRER